MLFRSEWLPGTEAQQAVWEAQYAEAHAKWEAHRAQVAESKRAEATAAGQSENPNSYSSPEANTAGLADDATLQALREKLDNAN